MQAAREAQARGFRQEPQRAGDLAGRSDATHLIQISADPRYRPGFRDGPFNTAWKTYTGRTSDVFVALSPTGPTSCCTSTSTASPEDSGPTTTATTSPPEPPS